jgi:hypothetical protein
MTIVLDEAGVTFGDDGEPIELPTFERS